MNEAVETLNLPYITVNQPFGTFYVCTMSVGKLLAGVDILPHGLSPEAQKNVQRSLNRIRQAEIAEFCRDPDATFPTSIIVAVNPDSDAIEIDENSRIIKIRLSNKFGEVIDGQHRLKGLELAIQKYSSDMPELRDFELPVALMFDLDPDGRAYVFSIINSRQTKVSSSLIADLFGLSELQNINKFAHDAAYAFNNEPGGPFYRGIKMLGTRQNDTEILTQGSFVKYFITELISRNPVKDVQIEKTKGKKALVPDITLPFRGLYTAGSHGFILHVLGNYFSAIRDKFPLEWSDQPRDFMLRKTAGYLALLFVFKEVWPTLRTEKTFTAQDFQEIADRLKYNSSSQPLTSANFPSSEQGAKQLATFLLNGPVNKSKPDSEHNP